MVMTPLFFREPIRNVKNIVNKQMRTFLKCDICGAKTTNPKYCEKCGKLPHEEKKIAQIKIKENLHKSVFTFDQWSEVI